MIENGLDLAQQLGLSQQQPVLKAGNWIGPVLRRPKPVSASCCSVTTETDHWVGITPSSADARFEVLAARRCSRAWYGTHPSLLQAASLEQAWNGLRRRRRPAEAGDDHAGAVEQQSGHPQPRAVRP